MSTLGPIQGEGRRSFPREIPRVLHNEINIFSYNGDTLDIPRRMRGRVPRSQNALSLLLVYDRPILAPWSWIFAGIIFRYDDRKACRRAKGISVPEVRTRPRAERREEGKISKPISLIRQKFPRLSWHRRWEQLWAAANLPLRRKSAANRSGKLR